MEKSNIRHIRYAIEEIYAKIVVIHAMSSLEKLSRAEQRGVSILCRQVKHELDEVKAFWKSNRTESADFPLNIVYFPQQSNETERA